jgi:hypothetical protein
MLATLGLSAHIFARSLTTSPGSYLDSLAERLTRYEHSIAATFGFESCTLAFPADDIEEALLWADRLLCPLTSYGADADLAWDGHLSGVELRVGGKSRSLSPETLANRVRTRYTTVLGSSGVTAVATSASSIAIYGTHDYLLSVSGVTASYAEGLRDSWLKRYASPRARPATTVRQGAPDQAGIEIVLTCAGWYASLGWVMLGRADLSNEATTAQVATLIGSASPGIGAVNGFLSTSAANIVTTGVSMTRKIEDDTTYRAAIEKRLAAGDTSDERYAWGVFDLERRLTVKQWAGASPTTIAYRLFAGDGVVETGGGVEVPFWAVRPDTMVEDVDLLPVGPPSGAADIAGRWYCERVVFSADQSGMTLTLEPEASSGLDARIARFSG